MTVSTQIKGILTGLASVAVIGVAIAQGTPPNADVTNPPVGAGQQSTQNTPMGDTGAQSETAAGPASSSTTMGATADTTGSDRTLRADRN